MTGFETDGEVGNKQNCISVPCVTGMTEKVIAKLVQKHEDETETLRNTQEKNRRNQEEKLKVLECLGFS